MASKLEDIAAQPEKVLDLHDEAIRQRLREVGRKLSYAMETPLDATRGLNSTVRRYSGLFDIFFLEHILLLTPSQPLGHPTALIGMEKGIFEALASGGTLTNTDLSKKTKIDPVLLSSYSLPRQTSQSRLPPQLTGGLRTSSTLLSGKSHNLATRA